MFFALKAAVIYDSLNALSRFKVDLELVCSKGKGKVFPYSLPSVGPGADPSVQAVSPQVT